MQEDTQPQQREFSDDLDQLLAELEAILTGDPGGEDLPDGQNEMDAEFIKALLTACLINIDTWIAVKGVRKTRKQIRLLFAMFLRKDGEPILTPVTREELELLRLFVSCLQCRRNFYTPGSASYGKYSAFQQCIKDCSP